MPVYHSSVVVLRQGYLVWISSLYIVLQWLNYDKDTWSGYHPCMSFFSGKIPTRIPGQDIIPVYHSSVVELRQEYLVRISSLYIVLQWLNYDKDTWSGYHPCISFFSGKIPTRIPGQYYIPMLFAGVTFLPLPRIPKIRELLMLF